MIKDQVEIDLPYWYWY